MRLEGLGKLKKFNDLNGNRTRDLTVCSKVPQPIIQTSRILNKPQVMDVKHNAITFSLSTRRFLGVKRGQRVRLIVCTMWDPQHLTTL
jgi:hypothetical protein